ncbi:hypothetical protein RJ641_017262 [Dillenia turbinata]|uniref:Cell differentiation protein rcd1 n=1 Tax=Dillenia turbinata TaxID=194707 RepID=A0AAN8Z0E0_9MAGN
MLSDSDKLDNLYGELFQEKVPGSSSTKTYVHPAYAIEWLKMATMEMLRDTLLEPEWREHALLLLNQRKSERPNMAEFLFEKPGVVATLFQELIVTYFSFSSELLTLKQSSRACNALALLQDEKVVKAIINKMVFWIAASLPNYIYPFLGTTSKENPFNFLRLTGLGVLGTLVKYDDEETVHYLLATGIFPQCLHCMDVGNELTKTVATFIIERILAHKGGLKYCCTIAERFYSVCKLLGNLVEALAEQPYPRLLKHVINCYYQMSESPSRGVTRLPDSDDPDFFTVH